MIVELVGVPGSGKSTIAVHLAERLRAEGLRAVPVQGHNPARPVTTRVGLLMRSLAGVMRLGSTPRLAWAGLPAVRGRQYWRDLLRLQRREAFRRRLETAGTVVVLDEGPLHKVALMGAETRVTRLGHLGMAITKPDLYVILDLDPDTALRRIRGRPSQPGPMDRLSDEEIEDYVGRYTRSLDAAMLAVDVPVFRVNSSVPVVDDIARAVLEADLRSSVPGSDPGLGA